MYCIWKSNNTFEGVSVTLTHASTQIRHIRSCSLTVTHMWLGINVGTIVDKLSHHFLLPCQRRDMESGVPFLEGAHLHNIERMITVNEKEMTEI